MTAKPIPLPLLLVGVLTLTLTAWPALTAPAPASAQFAWPVWTSRAAMPTARRDFALAAAFNGKLYAVGGYISAPTSPATTVEEYDPLTNTWRTRAPLNHARSALGLVAATNGKLYAAGGLGAASAQLSSVEEYDPSLNTWVDKAPMPDPRRSFGFVGGPGGKVYAVGGGWASSIVAYYDPSTNVWTNQPYYGGVPRVDAGVTTIVPGSYFFFHIGGNNTGDATGTLAHVDEYDAQTNRWFAITSMANARERFGAATNPVDRAIYAVGGAWSGHPEVGTSVEVLDTNTNVWSPANPLPAARSGHGVVTAANGRLYVVGGVDAAGNVLTDVLEGALSPLPPTVTATPTTTTTPTATNTPTPATPNPTPTATTIPTAMPAATQRPTTTMTQTPIAVGTTTPATPTAARIGTATATPAPCVVALGPVTWYVPLIASRSRLDGLSGGAACLTPTPTHRPSPASEEAERATHGRSPTLVPAVVWNLGGW